MLLEKNLSVLNSKNPTLANVIESTPLTNRYKMTPSMRKDHLPTLLDLKTNQNYYNVTDPLLAADNDISRRNIHLGNLAIFLGFGAGYQAIIYMTRFPDANILIAEKDPELLKTVFNEIDLTDLLNSPKVTLVGCEEPIALYPALFDFFNQSVNLTFLKSLNVIDIPQAFHAYGEYYISLIRTAKEAMTNVLNLYGNDPEDSLLGIRYTLRNIATIIDNPGIKDLKGIFKGKPGIVVATGPSLDKNIDYLDKVYNKAVIIAADASVKVIKKHGLKPAHFVTSLERVAATSKLFEGISKIDTKDSFLSACPVIAPETYENFPGEKIIVYRNFATFSWLDIPKGIVDTGPSSANMAFKILEFLGCDPIILIGQDLAYGADNKSHAEGFHYGSEFESKNLPNAIAVDGNYKDKVYTTPVWRMFLKHYERDIATYKGTVINATEGGAKIHGTKIMTFAECIDKYIPKENINPIETIRSNLKYSDKETKNQETIKVLEKLHHGLEFCNKVIYECEKALKICSDYDKILEKSCNEPPDETQKQLNKMLEEIISFQNIFKEKDFYLILMHYVQSYYIKTYMDINALRFSNEPSFILNVHITFKYKELYSILIQLIEKIVEEFKLSIDILEKYKKNI